MRAFALKATAVLVTVLATFGLMGATASAQTYPPVVPAPAPVLEFGPTGGQALALIQSNGAATDAANYAAGAASAAASGDAAGAAAAAAKAQAAADKANAILASFKNSTTPQGIIDQLAANAAKATAAAAAANASAGNVSVPAARAALPALAFTGSTTSVPVALGAGLVGLGGLALLAARKREQQS